jgi:hypothetical protein
MSNNADVEVSALAINVTIPEACGGRTPDAVRRSF